MIFCAENFYKKYINIKTIEIGENLKHFYRKIDSTLWRCSPSHNDPSPENFLYLKSQLYLIDWELSGLNDPAWDLAHFSVIGNVPLDHILSVYNSDDPLILEKIIFFIPLIYLNTALWSSYELTQIELKLPRDILETLHMRFSEEAQTSMRNPSFDSAILKLTKEISL